MSSKVETIMPSMGITKLKTEEKGYPNKNDSTTAANETIDSFIRNTRSHRLSFKERKVSEAMCTSLKDLSGAFSIRMYCISRTVVSSWSKIDEILTSGGDTDHVDGDDDDGRDGDDDDDGGGDDDDDDGGGDDDDDGSGGDDNDDDDDDDGSGGDGRDILIFLTTNITHGTKDNLQFHYEIYALISGHAHLILTENMCDREFPIKCAKRVLKFNLKALSSKQLFGPHSSQTTTYKQEESTMVTFWDYLGQITTSYKMPLRDDASLYRLCLRTKADEPRKASMTVGETYIRMSPEMSLKDIALLLYQLSRIARGEVSKKYQSEEKELDDKAFDVLYHVKIVKDENRIESFNNILMENIISHLSGQSENLGLYLSYPDLKAWENANVFQLSSQQKILQTWESEPPNLVDLLQVVKNNPTPEQADYREIIDRLSLQMCGSHEGISCTNPLLKYIYGEITENGKSLFFCGGKWLRIENEYIVSLEEQFSHLEQSHSLDGNVLVLPWLHSGEDSPNDNQISAVYFTGATLVEWLEEIFLRRILVTDEYRQKLLKGEIEFNDYMEKDPNRIHIQIKLFFRNQCKQPEKHYNEGYILYDQLFPDTSGYLLGDRIFLFDKNIELYDILFYTPEKTYLIHVKEGFGNTTRDVCSQIRNSAEVVFKHWICNNSFDILKKYWSSVTGYQGPDKYRQVVRDQYRDMGQERFLNLFDRKEIIYVLAYRDTKKTPPTMVPFVPYPKERLTDGSPGKIDEVVEELLRCKYLQRDDGRLRVTDKVFETVELARKEITLKPKAMAEDSLKILRETMSNHSSIIAKMEVVHLYSNFKRFVTPSKRLSLKMCSIRKNVLTQD